MWYNVEEGIKKCWKIEILEGTYHVLVLCPQVAQKILVKEICERALVAILSRPGMTDRL